MYNLVKIGKAILLFFIMIAIVNIAILIYVYTTSVSALEDTLNNISLVVAEENCLDCGEDGTRLDPTTDSKLYNVEKLMVENATQWLCYNDMGFSTSSEFSRNWRSDWHTDVQTDDCKNIEDAMQHINDEFLTFTADGYRNADMFSYEECPQRGEPITITLKANINIHLFFPIDINNAISNVSIPIERQVTVIGMKFYKGK